MARKRRTQTPKVLWRLFRHRARTLSAVLTSMLPADPPPELLRRGDPPAYSRLLNRCYVVAADSPPVFRAPTGSLWPQDQFVARTIEMMQCENSADSNVLCCAYDQGKQSSPFVELLSGPEWCLLLERVGGDIMYYLLKHMSIFLPVARSSYQQVAGPPSSKTCFEMSKRKFESRPVPSGPEKKREGQDILSPMPKRQQLTDSLDINRASSSFIGVGCGTDENFKTLLSSERKDKHCQMSEAVNIREENVKVNCKDDSRQCIVQNPIQTREVVKKRQRPVSWQPRKRRQLNSQETASTVTCELSTQVNCKDDFSKCVVQNPIQTPEVVKKRQRPRNRKRRQLNSQETASAVTCELSTPQNNSSLGNSILCTLEKHFQPKVSKGAQITRKFMFHNSERVTSAFPRKHVLNTLKPNSSGVRFLLKSIFGFSDEVINSDLSLSDSASVCWYIPLSKWLKNIIRRAQTLKHLRLLNKHCGVSTPDQKDGRGFDNQCGNSLNVNGPEAIKSYCQKSQVESFVWAVCRSIVPPEMLGTASNWRRLRTNIFKFVQLRRYEIFSLKQCMYRMKSSAFPFLDTVKGFITPIMKQRLLESWIYWIFSCIVLPLLQANFYITETEHGRHDMFYYRKEVWEKVTTGAVADLKAQSYTYLDNETARDIVKSRRFGFSKLKLIPKRNGVRLLGNLQAPSRILKQDVFPRCEIFGISKRSSPLYKKKDFHYFKSVNSGLRDARAVLKGIQLNEPERLGSSVFDYNDVYRRLCSFKTDLGSGSSGIPAVYIIAADVSRAFDSVDHDKLLSVIEDVIGQEKYTVKQFSQVLCTKKALWVRENVVLCDQNVNPKPFQPLDSILVNQHCRKSLKRRELLVDLSEHVKRNVLQLDKKLYWQRVGISQGSILSSLLCSLYYGDMDNKVIFPYLKKAIPPPMEDVTRNPVFEDASCAQITNSDIRYMLLRFVDGFFFISTSQKQAENFFFRLLRGFRAYNCYMNDDKLCANFDIQDLPEAPSRRLCVGKDGAYFFRWSGLLVNSRTLEVQADYTKYYNIHLSSSITINWQNKSGRHLEARLCDYMMPKCHPIFYDSNINSADIVRLNVFQAFVLCAMKFHCYVRELSYICKFRGSSYLRFIEKAFRFMHVLIKKRMHLASLGSKTPPILRLKDEEVEWLGLNAFIQVLKRKRSHHKELLPLLTRKLSLHNLSGNTTTELDYAIDAAHSSIMWQIKY